jgi:hypothetical protein
MISSSYPLAILRLLYRQIDIAHEWLQAKDNIKSQDYRQGYYDGLVRAKREIVEANQRVNEFLATISEPEAQFDSELYGKHET